MFISMTRFSAAAVIACSAIAGAGVADVIYVDDDAPVGGDGMSWQTAFNDLQLALAVAVESDEIRVAQGIYKPAPPNGPREATFSLVNGTTLRGGYAGLGADDPDANDPEMFETILSGDLNGDDGPEFVNRTENSYQVITADGVAIGTQVRGLTIQGGEANIDFPEQFRYGGGVYCRLAAVITVDQCLIRENRAYYGGGGIYNPDGELIIDECTFISNIATVSPSNRGGAIFCRNASIQGSKFIANRSAIGHGGAIYSNGDISLDGCLFEQNFGGVGGAVSSDGGTLTARRCSFISNVGEIGGSLHSRGSLAVVECDFFNNSASDWGGAISSQNGPATLVNCRLFRNSSTFAGAIMNFASLYAVNCIFLGNWCSYSGGALQNHGVGDLVHCTFIGNTTGNYQGSRGGGIYSAGNSLSLRNCALWENFDPSNDVQSGQLFIPSGTIALHHSCIQGWTGTLGGTNNHGNDPRFIDAIGPDGIYGTDDDNPRLLANSPLINRGDASALPPDAFDLDEDGDTTEPIPVDLDWLPRIVGRSVDVGAFEFQGVPCRADINGDGGVNVSDLLAVINAWGACVPGQMCNADLDLNGSVGVSDLMLVITTWGECP